MLGKIINAFEDEQFLIADGLDEAIIGVDYDKFVIIYSVKKVIEVLCRDMIEEDAWEHFSFNIQGAYVGEKTPIWCYDLFK
jgi:hypothetical protein